MKSLRIVLLVGGAAIALATIRYTILGGQRAGEPVDEASHDADAAQLAPPTSRAGSKQQAAPRRVPDRVSIRPSVDDQGVLAPPARTETYGVVGALRAEFVSQPFDAAATGTESDWAEELLQSRGIDALTLEVACSDTLCRADMTFADAPNARELARLRIRGTREPVALDERLSDGRVRVVAYWGTSDETVPEMVQRLIAESAEQ